MELIRISDHKLKIMLTPLDMCHFELNAETFGEDSEKLHGAFRLLLEEIRKQTDFEGDDNHLSVQYFPSREGGCEMFISHLRHEDGTSKKASQRPSLLPAAKSASQLESSCANLSPSFS
jgi:negative regulator of genetic competence, sporulation and motility